MLRTALYALAVAALSAGAAAAQSKDEVWTADDGGAVVLRPNKTFDIAVTHETTREDVFETGRISGEERPAAGRRVLSLKTARGPVWTLRTEDDGAELRDPQDRKAATLKK